MILHSVTPDRAHLVQDDPVRPNLSYDFRVSNNKDFYCIENEMTGDPFACICISYNDFIPTTTRELVEFPDFSDPPRIAVFYTVWSYEKGYGREIIFKAVDKIKEKRPEVMRFVTLSPKTEMAKRFHERNGAVMIADNPESYNFEYRNL